MIVGAGETSPRFAAGVQMAGVGSADSSHASLYEQPLIATISPALSEGLFHPLPALIVLLLALLAVAVNTGAASVGTEPVGVYDGSSVTGPAFVIVVGGHSIPSVAAAPSVEAVAPPVALAASVPVHGAVFPHCPTASRGSVGIHPCSRPSEYDQLGDSTRPLVDELPTFQVQKNQFCKASMEAIVKVLTAAR